MYWCAAIRWVKGLASSMTCVYGNERACLCLCMCMWTYMSVYVYLHKDVAWLRHGTVQGQHVQYALLLCRPEAKALSRKHEDLVKKVNALMAKKAQ